MKRLLIMIVIAMTVFTACEASDPYDGEGIVAQSAMDAIKTNSDCADLQATFDRNWELTQSSDAGSLNHKRGGKFMTAADARMGEAGCYE